jgi:carbonic anhydrase
MEYACKVSGSKLVMVLGHEYCGAIKDVESGNITTLLNKIQSAVSLAKRSFIGDQNVENPKFVETVCYHNVEHAIKKIREKSFILREMEEKGEFAIIGGVYDMETGIVDFMDENK